MPIVHLFPSIQMKGYSAECFICLLKAIQMIEYFSGICEIGFSFFCLINFFYCSIKFYSLFRFQLDAQFVLTQVILQVILLHLHYVHLFIFYHFFEIFQIAIGISFYQIQFSQFLLIPFIPANRNVKIFNYFYDRIENHPKNITHQSFDH